MFVGPCIIVKTEE